jgi:hypothetical protein
MKIKCSFIPDIIEMHDFEKDKTYIWKGDKIIVSRETVNILVLDMKGNVLQEIKKHE